MRSSLAVSTGGTDCLSPLPYVVFTHPDPRGCLPVRHARAFVSASLHIPAWSRRGGWRCWTRFRRTLHFLYVDCAYQTSYLLPNVPVVLPSGLVDAWPAWSDWRGERVDWERLAACYGDHTVPVVEGIGEETKRTTCTVREAVDRIQSQVAPTYLKDWHLVRAARTDTLSQASEHEADLRRQLPYHTPGLFADDWMNNSTPHTPHDDPLRPYRPDAWLASDRRTPLVRDDFRFCYAGTAGTVTGLHRDGRPSDLPSLYVSP